MKVQDRRFSCIDVNPVYYILPSAYNLAAYVRRPCLLVVCVFDNESFRKKILTNDLIANFSS